MSALFTSDYQPAGSDPEVPGFLIGTLVSLIMAWSGNVFHELNVHLTMPALLHFAMNCAKGFCYIGSGLVGLTTLWRFLRKMKN